MSRPDVADVLATCLDDIRAGRRTPAECLAAYPDLRGSLEPLLRTALQIEPLQPPPLDARGKALARKRFVAALHGERDRQAQRWFRFPALAFGATRGVATVLAAVLVLVIGSAIALASQQALPGDPLYGVKTTVEQAGVIMAPTDLDKAVVEMWVAERRLTELQRSLDEDRADSAYLAAEEHASAVLGACDNLDRAIGQGKDVGGFGGRLTAIQQGQEAALRLAASRGDERVRPALEQAQAEAREEAQDLQGNRTGG